ncbi:glycine--tRNA ligase subunit beta [Desulfonatronospira sp.]|uniref:glycine--tRNA ligase subunit beta n=1 Tax=Desulfonatronospira sp. TaxID=1962951 RepID=UPI0025B9B4BD|nr:glycine--tRNA ligase subunit beta [Desulfonatronospira sp.]
MPDFVLEVGFEEMPARFLKALTHDFRQSLMQELESQMLDCENIQAWATPRRLSAYVFQVAQYQIRKEDVITGPPVAIGLDQENRPTKAGLGFARSQQVDVQELMIQDTEKGGYLAVKKTVGGRPAREILPQVCEKVIISLGFPKKMRWWDRFTFGRPVRWILAKMDGLNIEFQIADTKSGNITYGHRVLGPGPYRVDQAADYFRIVRDQAQVILNFQERKDIILKESANLARAEGGSIIANDRLADENANLTEFPVPIMGSFDSMYLELPREVLLTSMESHQKSFGVLDGQGRIMPNFVAVINNRPDPGGIIKKGWERVLKARLEDARFFWNVDKSTSFDQWMQKLEKVVFLAPLGSMGEKSRRLERICGFLCDKLQLPDKKDIQTAGRICKADLVSEMVGEFADLQGIMGGIYASHAGYNDKVARAVYQHYLPLGPESDLPSTTEGAIVSLADKVDNLVGCFGLDMLPSGAADPYALRRQSLGMIRIVLGRGLRLDMENLISFTARNYEGVDWKQDPEQALEKLLHFFSIRLKTYWQGQGYEGKLVDAVLHSGFSDMYAAEKRLQAILDFSLDENFEAAVLTYKRVDNIIRKQAQGVDLSLDYQPGLLQEEQEINLDRAIKEIMSDWEDLWQKEDFRALFAKLNALRPSVDAFFDHVMVMCDDEKLRQNRLRLLNYLSLKFKKLADFSALQV